MAHQYMPKIFHDPHKNPPAPLPTYLMYGPLKQKCLLPDVAVLCLNSRCILLVSKILFLLCSRLPYRQGNL